MQVATPLTRLVLSAFLLATASVCVAQGPPGQDPYNPPPGHGGVPPGQAKKQGYAHVPPGQAKKYNGEFRFRNDDRGQFYAHYRGDADRWRNRRRPTFVRGQVIPREYVVQPVPVGVQPPPYGYQYGYYGGYVVAYDPTTRIIADVMDLVGVAVSR